LILDWKRKQKKLVNCHKFNQLNEEFNGESGAVADTINSGLSKEWRVPRNLSLDNVIGKVQKGV